MNIPAYLSSAVQRIGVLESDTGEVRLQKAILVSGSVLIVAAATVWGLIYLAYRERLAAALSLGYASITLTSLVVFTRTRQHRFFLFSQLLLGLIIPFLHTLILGGFWNSGVVFIWSLLSSLGTLIYYRKKEARWWWAAFLVLLAVGIIYHPLIQHENNLPLGVRRAYFAMNIGGASSIVFVLLNYFIDQKDEAYRLLHLEEQKSQSLLLNILPKEIAAILKNENRTIADSFEGVSILFADLVDFTPLTANMPPVTVVNLLNEVFSHFDSLVEKYGVEKIRTIGDNYMVVAGAPRPCPDHACRLAALALDMQAYIQSWRGGWGIPVEFRIGINSGPVIGGVIGRKKFVYDIWGDAVNIASRMESHGVPGKIQVTGSTYDLIREVFVCERRGTIQVKGWGAMETWFVLGPKR